MSVFRVALSLTNIEIRCASVTEAPRKRLRNDKYGEDYARRRISQSTKLTVADKYLVNDVVKRADKQREDAGDREF